MKHTSYNKQSLPLACDLSYMLSDKPRTFHTNNVLTARVVTPEVQTQVGLKQV